MPNLRNLTVGFALGVLTTASLARALEVKLPKVTTPKATFVADELGNLLFGANAARVEITNLPAESDGEPVSFVADVTGLAPTASLSLFVVPSDRRLLLTDLDVAQSASGPMALRDSAGLRLFVPGDPSLVRNYSSGVVFGPGETVQLIRLDGFNVLGVHATFAGRLLPVS